MLFCFFYRVKVESIWCKITTNDHPKKSEKSPRSRNTQRRRKEEEKRESKSDVYFSLSSERVLLCLHGPSRAIALVSLLTFCFLLFSSDNNAFKERALKKDIKNIYWCTWCAFPEMLLCTQKKARKHTDRKATFMCVEKKSFLEPRRDFRGAP